ELHFFFLEDLEEARRLAETAVRVDPDNFGAHRILARVFALKAGLDEGRLDRAAAEQAIKELKDVVRLKLDDAEAHALLGEFYLLTGRTPEAIESFKRWAAAPVGVDTRFYEVITRGRELSPASASARLAEVLLREGRTREAVEAIRNALSMSPENPNYFALLEQAINAGEESQGAVAELQRIVNANPANLPAIRLLAQTQARAGRLDDAAATLRAGINRRANTDREQQELVGQLAALYADALRYEEAIAVYENALKTGGIGDGQLTVESDKALASWALERIVRLHRQAGKYAEALAAVERMRRLLGPDSLSADEQTVEILREQGKRSEALAAAKQARAKHPNEFAFLNLEATALAELGQVDQAAALLRGELKGRVESDYFIYLSLIQLLLDSGRAQEGVEAARKLLDITPPNQPQLMTQSLIMLSSAQERAGDPKGAEESLRKLLSTDPNNATVLNNLGYFLTERNERLTEALDMIKRAVRVEPTNPSFLDSLGWVYFKLGQLEEAERYLGEAARRNGQSATIQEHLGDVYQSRGKAELARATWRKALNLSTEPAQTARIKAKLDNNKR
ncbi:MAG: tetratricopeptide repeat protein, partial [Pyrinomonadaceae bacterium]